MVIIEKRATADACRAVRRLGSRVRPSVWSGARIRPRPAGKGGPSRGSNSIRVQQPLALEELNRLLPLERRESAPDGGVARRFRSFTPLDGTPTRRWTPTGIGSGTERYGISTELNYFISGVNTRGEERGLPIGIR